MKETLIINVLAAVARICVHIRAFVSTYELRWWPCHNLVFFLEMCAEIFKPCGSKNGCQPLVYFGHHSSNNRLCCESRVCGVQCSKAFQHFLLCCWKLYLFDIFEYTKRTPQVSFFRNIRGEMGCARRTKVGERSKNCLGNKTTQRKAKQRKRNE